MERNKIRVGITQGDINGVGYEVIFKTFSDPAMLELCTPIIYGSPKVAAYHRKAMELQANFSIVNSASEASHGKLSVVNCANDEVKVEFAKPAEESGRAALDALERALTEYRAGLIDVLVTAPINKATIQSETFHFPGHTEYIEERAGKGNKALMILMKDDFKTVIAGTHSGKCNHVYILEKIWSIRADIDVIPQRKSHVCQCLIIYAYKIPHKGGSVSCIQCDQRR